MTFGRLTRSDTFLRWFKAVADSVADHVQQRIHHPFHDQLVDLCLVTGQLQADFFMALPLQATDHKTHPVEDLPNGHHSHAHDTFAEIAQLTLEQEVGVLKVAPRRHWQDRLEPAQTLFHVAAADHQVAHHRHELVKALHFDAHNAR